MKITEFQTINAMDCKFRVIEAWQTVSFQINHFGALSDQFLFNFWIFLNFSCKKALAEKRHNFSQSHKHLEVVGNFTENIFAGTEYILALPVLRFSIFSETRIVNL